ncbi:MAG TPA: transglutaminase domain-containing protein, partial [Candidatus Thermoplasmatota archaeon]|nr:transglutaminase domain-containing protein [Candidatus Thermoplasmatota archaeon]
MRSTALALAALALAAALVVPATDVLAPGLRSLHRELADGDFKPFEGTPFDPERGDDEPLPLSDEAGGVTGSSAGNFLPQPGALSDDWPMDRDGTPGEVTIDFVFEPALGAMKRLKAYDRVGPSYVLSVSDDALQAPTDHKGVYYDRTFVGRFPVQLEPGVATPIYSPDAAAVPLSVETAPSVPGGVVVLKDGADTFHLRARDPSFHGVVNLTIQYKATSRYFELDLPEGVTVDAYAAAERPRLDPALGTKAQRLLASVGLAGENRIDAIVPALVRYFSAFGEGPIPPPTEYADLYEAIAYGQDGCCRHRAFAFLVTAQAAGVPTRVVVNEAHAFVEVLLPGQGWRQANLGGCGTYRVNNPDGMRQYHSAASDPTLPGNAPVAEPPPDALLTTTTLTKWPDAARKGTPFLVAGRVLDERGRGVGGAAVDVFVNATKTTPGHLSGRGRTDANGAFAIRADIPREAPARDYQLVAHAHDLATGTRWWRGSWSDPEIRVEAATRFALDVPARDGAGLRVPVRGRLVDVLGGPAPDARVTLAVDGASYGALITDETGAFEFLPVFHAKGTHVLAFAFEGDRWRDAATATWHIRIDDTSLDLPSTIEA